MKAEVLSLDIIQNKISEAQNITEQSDVVRDSLFIILGETSIPLMEILRAEEYGGILPFDYYTDGEYNGDTECTCLYGTQNSGTAAQILSPSRMVRDNWRMLWPGSTITYRIKNCPSITDFDDAILEWKNACPDLTFKEIKDNGWNRFL